MLRVGPVVFGDVDTPVRCADAGAGCWLLDAGAAAAYSPGPEGGPDGAGDVRVALSVLEATPPGISRYM